MSIVLIKAKPTHAALLMRHMRERDVLELWQGWSMTPEEMLKTALDQSYAAYTAMYGLRPICMFGLVPGSFVGGWAQFWIVGSKYIDEHPLAFARATRKYAPLILRDTDLATNFIAEDDEPAMKWAKWAGARVLPDTRINRQGRWFVQFVVEGRREQCQQA